MVNWWRELKENLIDEFQLAIAPIFITGKGISLNIVDDITLKYTLSKLKNQVN
ncbi:hypothetical protein P4576_01735 [Peribacillus frigoritolerans]|uniref:hypothetical protein n=1 Tax=Peribacillus frigoritolerans TaxID=450367 RepID=UPI002E1EA2ED|nr:hypothetical protein [Peribacillus frigoritolerans]